MKTSTITSAVFPPAPAPSSRSALIAEGARRHKFGAGLMMLIAAAVLAAAGYGIFALLHRPQPVPFQNMSISKLTDTGKAFMAAISPDAKYVVHVVEDAGQQSLWFRHIPTNSVTQIVPPADTHYSGLTFSLDGNHIYYNRTEKDRPGLGLLYRIPVLGGTPRLIVTSSQSLGHAAHRRRPQAAHRLQIRSDLRFCLVARRQVTGPLPRPGQPRCRSVDGHRQIAAARLRSA